MSRARAAAPAAHPFFCHVKGVRKSAWATPEYLSAADWQLAREALAAATPEDLHALLYTEPARAEVFFYRVVGWAEGRHYMRDIGFVRASGWAGLQRHAFPRLREALAARDAG